ncbi:hypothetical protein ATO6_12355 [Oceanicola sp. 22II-s10i]|nr:hypothetical protein ATO6_12355 [Oceanicola sp. 22II-s10i]
MTILKNALAASTAIGLLASPAFAANDNDAFLSQSGDDNTASIVQSGNGNAAGTAARNVRQNGDNNELDILQSGNGNKAGATGDGFNQSFNRNKLLVTQSGNDNETKQILQRASFHSVVSNDLTIMQSSDDNFIGVVNQDIEGNITDPADGNIASITQQVGDGNDVQRLEQLGRNNDATILQSGTGNTILAVQQGDVYGGSTENNDDGLVSISQVGANNFIDTVEQFGSGHSAILSITGDSNGTSGFSSGKAAEAAGAFNASSQQFGVGNSVQMTILNASSNQFGFYQDGTGNMAVNILITGDANELGVHQTGTDNSLDLGTIAGMENIVGLIQNGSGNVASLDVIGDQNGGYNAFTGADAIAVGLTMPGLMEQIGTNNQIAMSVSGTGNVFAFYQEGASLATGGNTIVGSQDNSAGGAYNQAAVMQVGDGNAANFTQIGGGNVAGISQ